MHTSTTSQTNTLLHQTESNTAFHYSSDFLEWLRIEEISLAISTYQTNKLFLIGRDTTKHLFVSECPFDRAMGLHVESENSFYLSTRFLLWRFENAMAEGQIHNESDKIYIPRQAFNTGDLNVHDVAIDENKDIVFVNTRYNCVAKVSEKYNFKPLWMPPFISKMIAEDRCHLNGLAMRDGKPRYVTAISQTDFLDSWREHRQDGGIVMDMQTSEVLVDGLSMPHSPRYYQDKIWVLNAGRGEFGYVEDNKFIAITQLDGFLRGLAFHKNYALIGLSRPRHEGTFTGLPLDNILQARNIEPQCGICVVDINTGEIIHKFEIKGEVTELYDIQILPNVKRPTSFGINSDQITRYISVEGDEDTVDFKALVVLEDKTTKKTIPATSSTSTTAPKTAVVSSFAYSIPETSPDNFQKTSLATINPIQSPINSKINSNTPIFNSTTAAPSINDIKYQLAENISVAQIIEQFDILTFPKLSLQVTGRIFNGSLGIIVAKNQLQPVGAIVVELYPNQEAKLISWFVLPAFRNLGIGKELLTRAEKVLQKNQFYSITTQYRSDWKSIEKINSIFTKNNWEEAKVGSSLYKTRLEEVAKASWIQQEYTNPEIEMFLWNTLTSEEKQQIQNKQVSANWYPITVDPFINQENKVSALSFGLRYKGEVFGWLITHSLKSDSLEFAHLFVDTKVVGNELSNYTIFLSLLSNGIVKGNEQGYKYGLFQVQHGNETMHKFIDRYMRPYLISEADTILRNKNNQVIPSKTEIKYPIYQLDINTIIQHFNALTFPRLDALSQTRQINEPLLVMVAQNATQQIGTAIIELKSNGAAQLISWYVLPPFRNLGIGKELLSQTEKILRQNKLNSIYTDYRSDWTNTATFEHILATRKWEAPQTKMYICKSSIDIISEAPWMSKLHLPEGMELYPWKNTTQEEKKEILRKKQAQNWYPEHLSPFQHEDKMDLATSVSLKYNGKIVGWMITHRLKADTVEFTAAFVDQNATGGGLRKQSLFLPVLAQSLYYLREDGAKYGIWQMQVDNPSIHKFLDKFLKPYLISFVELKFSYKVL